MIVFKQPNKIEIVNAIKKIPLLPAAIAIVIAGFFAIAYFNNHKFPSGNVEIGNQQDVRQEPQSESRTEFSTSTENQGNIQITEGDYIDAAPETEINRGQTTNASAPLTVPASGSPKDLPTVAPKLSGDFAARDERRQIDMRRLAAAQVSWYGDHKKYYTCGTTGGDCRGKANSLPSSIGSAGNSAVDPVNAGRVCGRDYTYCGIDNTQNSKEFCYYAKLEAGGYYGVSRLGSFKRASPPLSLADCAVAPLEAKPEIETPLPLTPQQRDLKRQNDMSQLSVAQSKWFGLKSQYYTCGTDGGDCLGKTANYPVTMGFALAKTPVDPLNSGGGCGGGYIYCGLDNFRTAFKFCYFAKMETGGYYAVSNSGSYRRSTPPATFGECGQPN
jgi:hypothetical protein